MTKPAPKVGDILISTKDSEEVFGYDAVYEVINVNNYHEYYSHSLMTIAFIFPEDSRGELITVTKEYYEKYLVNIS
jgi:hypothetical protein